MGHGHVLSIDRVSEERLKDMDVTAMFAEMLNRACGGEGRPQAIIMICSDERIGLRSADSRKQFARAISEYLDGDAVNLRVLMSVATD